MLPSVFRANDTCRPWSSPNLSWGMLIAPIGKSGFHWPKWVSATGSQALRSTRPVRLLRSLRMSSMLEQVQGSVTTASSGRAVSLSRLRMTRYWPKPEQKTTSTWTPRASPFARAALPWRSC